MSVSTLLVYIAVMAGVTYLFRLFAFVLFKKKIENVSIRSFIFYIPYAVLGAMTFPEIFYSTGSVLSACVGLAVALVLAFYEKGLLTVAVCACGAVFLTEWVTALC